MFLQVTNLGLTILGYISLRQWNRCLSLFKDVANKFNFITSQLVWKNIIPIINLLTSNREIQRKHIIFLFLTHSIEIFIISH